MSLPEFGVKRPITNLTIFLAIVILAIYSLTRIGIDSMPKIEPPVISVISVYPGASPEDVEVKITEPLENQLATTPGLEKITSRSMEGISVISLKFSWGTNLDASTNEIRDRIDLAKRFLPDIPDEMDNPYIWKFNTSNIPILFLGITADQTYPDLYNLIDKRVGDPLRQLPGVGTVELIGGLQRQINVWIDRDKLEGYGFSILDIQNVLKSENITQPVGSLKTGLTDYLVRLPGEFTAPEEMDTVILGARNGKVIYLKDVARIEDSFKEETSAVRINNKAGLMMMIQKQTDTNTVEVAGRVKKKLSDLVKVLPKDVKMVSIFDTSKDIITSLNSLKESVWMGIVLVVIVVWFFLRQFLPSFIVALSIPFSLLIAFIYLFLNGRTINTISLSSLAIATGLVVDDAIVVVDNIFRRLERGYRPNEAAIFGTQEMFLAISASTLTTIVVFLPMLLITGSSVGIIFGELAIIITVTLLGSLFTATTFTPMLCSKWLKYSTQQAAQITKVKTLQRFYDFSENIFKSWEEAYGKALNWCLGHKKLVIFGFLGVLVFSLLLTVFVGSEFIPEEDIGDVRLNVQLPLGTRLEETDKIAERIEKIFIEDVPQTEFYYVRSGEVSGIGRAMGNASGSNIIQGGLKLIPKDKRNISVKEVGQLIRNKVNNMPGVLKADISTGNPIGRLISGSSGKAVQIEIVGNSFEETDAIAAKIKSIVEKVPGTVDITISREMDRPELRIEINREKAASLGLNMSTIANTLKTYIQGTSATKYREKGDTYDIYVRLEESGRVKIEDIENLMVMSLSKKEPIKLSNIAKIVEIKGPLEIERKNRERVVRVECNIYKRSMGKVIEDIKREYNKLAIPSDIMIDFGGEAEEQKKAFVDLLLLLILSVVLVYLVMAAQFESLLDPFIIMFAIPFTFIGVILSFILTGTTLSVVSFLGIIMLMGIVVKNAIVLVSYIILLRARGLSINESIVSAGKHRLRPVLMTTICAIVGLLPLAFSRGEGSEVWQPLGITMFGGLSVSTMITLLYVPTLYSIFEAKVKKAKK